MCLYNNIYVTAGGKINKIIKDTVALEDILKNKDKIDTSSNEEDENDNIEELEMNTQRNKNIINGEVFYW
jgi:hypothetical protein